MNRYSLSAVIAATAALLAAAPVAHATNLVTNGDFSATTFIPAGTFAGGTTSTGWSGTGNAGVADAEFGGVWDNGSVPGGQGSGGYVGFILAGQDAGPGDTLSTTVNGLTIGDQYLLSFYANARAYNQGPSTPGDDNSQFSVFLGATPAFINAAISNIDGQGNFTDPFTLFTATITATATSEVLTFQNTDSNSADTVLIANVALDDTAVPEPVSLALMGAGLAGLGVIRRRKKS